MAITASGVYLQTIKDCLTGGASAVDLDTDTIKGGLVTNASTPDFDDTTAPVYGDLTEASDTNTNYVADGEALSGLAVTVGSPSAGTLYIEGTLGSPANWSNVEMTARGLGVHSTTQTKALVCVIDFTQDVTATDGQFTVNLDTDGYIQIDLTP